MKLKNDAQADSTPPTGSKPAMPRAIWALGFVSLLMDISSELIHSLLPMFMVTVLGASAFMIGLVDGIGEATALVVKVFSGALSDRWGKRKPLALFGYGLGALSKPLFALATSSGLVLAARVIDRVGKGIRGAPRDALVADISPPAIRGAAFGLRQSLDTVGAFVGPTLAIVLMLSWRNDFRAVFWVAIVPGLCAVVLLFVGIKESEHQREPGGRPINPISREQLGRLPARYWWVVVVGGAFSLARFSEAFLVLKAQKSGLAVAWTPLVLIAMNIVYSMAAYPFGKLADHMSHEKLLALGLAVLLAADLMLASGSSAITIIAGILFWGLHMAMTQGLLSAMVAEVAPEHLRGTAFGLFNLASGIATLLASLVAGALWDRLGPGATFLAGATFCMATLGGIVFKPRK